MAVLVAGVLAASLGVIHRSLARQLIDSARSALAVAGAHFRLLEERRWETLEVAATALEQEPGFRNVLRTHDAATIQDYLQSARQAYRVELILTLNADGGLEASTTPLEEPPAGLKAALEGAAGHAYWMLGGQLFQVAYLPLEGAGDRVVGALLVGLKVDQQLLERLARDTGCTVVLEAQAGQPLAMAGPPLVFVESVPSHIALGRARLSLHRSTAEAWAQIANLTRWLAGLGVGALAVALVVSYPLLGHISNPVEELARAEARLHEVVDANLDGLVALDPQGRVTLANPAAARALGHDLEELPGMPLEGLVDNETADRLLSEPEGRLSQVAVFEREGRRFRLQRTFLAQGSLLVVRDITHERDWEQRTTEFFGLLSQQLRQPDARNLDNLAVLADASPSVAGPVAVASLPGELELEGEPGLVFAPEKELRLVLLNLLDNARRYGGQVRAGAIRDGGAVEFWVSDSGPGFDETRTREITDGSYPKRFAEQSGLGLGLYVCRTLLLAMGSRLAYEPLNPGTRFHFWLPEAPP